MKFTICFLTLIAVASAACSTSNYKFRVIQRTASNAAGLASTVASYRAALGGVDNVDKPGPIYSGHRSINWDAPGLPFDMPGNFFDKVVPRGIIFKTARGEFRVSNPGPPIVDDRFNSILPPSVSTMFQRFSAPRLFSPLFSNKFKAVFRVPDKNQKAAVTGFGAVFTDVDAVGKTKITYLDRSGCKLAVLKVAPKNRGLSFAGLVVLDKKTMKPVPVVARIKVELGSISLWNFARNYAGVYFADVVVADDFIYGEPQPY